MHKGTTESVLLYIPEQFDDSERGRRPTIRSICTDRKVPLRSVEYSSRMVYCMSLRQTSFDDSEEGRRLTISAFSSVEWSLRIVFCSLEKSCILLKWFDGSLSDPTLWKEDDQSEKLVVRRDHSIIFVQIVSHWERGWEALGVCHVIFLIKHVTFRVRVLS